MNEWQQIFGNVFADALGAQQAQPAWSGLGGAAAAQVPLSQPEGRVVDGRLRNEMIIRRCGNICRHASGEGWKAKRTDRNGFHQVWFRKDGEMVAGTVAASPAQALVNACETMNRRLGM